MPEIICKCGCGRKKHVRQSDVNRGWGLYYSKACKAKVQARREGNKPHIDQRKKDAYEHGGIPTYNNQGGYSGFRIPSGCYEDDF